MNYKFLDSIMIRTPLRPRVTKGINKNFLLTFFQNKQNREALYLGSTTLYYRLLKFENENSFSKKEEAKLFFSLFKYMSRMSSRCTPFGLFASSGIIKWGDESKVIIDHNFFRRTNLDMEFSVALSSYLSTMPSLKKKLKFKPNSSIYEQGGTLRYIEYYHEKAKRKHQISAVQANPLIHEVLDISKLGKTIYEIQYELIRKYPEYGGTQIQFFLNELVDNQLLTSDIEVTLTGKDHLTNVLEKLKNLKAQLNDPELDAVFESLLNVQELLLQTDSFDKKGDNREIYLEILKQVENCGIGFDESKLFQLDLFHDFNSSSTISSKHQKKILATLNLLRKLSIPKKNTALENFKKKFQKKYGDREVELLKAIDSESGLGYANKTSRFGDYNPLLDNLFLGDNSNSSKYYWSTVESFLLRKVHQAYVSNETTITISEDELSKFGDNPLELPDSMHLGFQLVQIGNEDKLVLNYSSGPSATTIIGRFATGNKEIRSVAEEIVQYENDLNSEGVLAEIVHLPEKRVGNILSRPIIREYEIPILCNSQLAKSNQIELSDLFISIIGDELILKSKSVGKQIIPRMANAHNYDSDSLPVYHFLCDLQSQSKSTGINFSWGNFILDEFVFLPRVVINDVIVSLARWRLQKKDFEVIINSNDLTIVKNVALWRRQNKIPAQFSLNDGDNRLFIDSNDQFQLLMFQQEIKNKLEIILEENIEKEMKTVKDLESQYHSHEFVCFLVKQLEESETPLKDPNIHEKAFDQGYHNTHEWLYYKLYCGAKTSDEIVSDFVLPMMDEFLQESLIDQWFFIRFDDPEFHLRVRFKLNDKGSYAEVTTRFLKGVAILLENELIWNVQTDVYQRELRRYGYETISIAEQFFYHDSVFIAKALRLMQSIGEDRRWLIAIRSIDDFLSDFGFSKEGRRDLLIHLSSAYNEEFKVQKHQRKSINIKYRENRHKIERILSLSESSGDEMDAVLLLLSERCGFNSKLADKINTLRKHQDSTVPFLSLLSSLIHMMLNRIFRENQREHELVIYNFLLKHYESQIARKNEFK